MMDAQRNSLGDFWEARELEAKPVRVCAPEDQRIFPSQLSSGSNTRPNHGIFDLSP